MSYDSFWLALSLFPAVLIGFSVGQVPPGYQQTTCSVLQQLALTSTCQISSSCCTRLQCGVFISTTAQLQILPCTTPPSINVEILQGTAVLYNRTFQQSEDIRISQVPFFPAVHLGLEQTQDYSSVTFSLIVGGTTIIPRTPIPIDRSQCLPHQPLDACPTTAPPTATVPFDPTPPTLSTCQSLRGLAGRLGTCMVDNDCRLLHCTFLNQYPADLSIEPCLDPPSVTVVVRQSDGGTVLVNETLTQSRTQPVSIGNQYLFDLTVVIDHRDNPDIIVITVLASPSALPTNITLIPRTVIPLDRSNCSTNITGVHTADIPLPPTSATTESDTCRTLKQLSGTIQGACNTDQSCNSVLCDLNLLGISYRSNLTVLPCLEVPGIQLVIINSQNNSVVLNRTLTKSGLENITVGGSNLTLNETVIQSPDQSSLVIQVDILLPRPLPSIPILPRTKIPLDRCDCPNINCATSPPPIISTGPGGTGSTEIVYTEPAVFTMHTESTESEHTKATESEHTKATESEHTKATESEHTKATESEHTKSTEKTTPVKYPGSVNTTQSTEKSKPQSSSNTVQVVLPVAMVAGVLMIALIVVVAAALAYFIYIKRKNRAYGFQRMSFKDVKEDE